MLFGKLWLAKQLVLHFEIGLSDTSLLLKIRSHLIMTLKLLAYALL